MKVFQTSLLLILMLSVGEIHAIILKEREMRHLAAKALPPPTSKANERSLAVMRNLGVQLASSPMISLVAHPRKMFIDIIFNVIVGFFQITWLILWWGNGKFLLFLLVVIIIVVLVVTLTSKKKKGGKTRKARSLKATLGNNKEIHTAQKLYRTLKRQVRNLRRQKLDLLKNGAHETHIGRKLQKINEALQQKAEAQEELKSELDLAKSDSTQNKRESIGTYRAKLTKSNDILGVFQGEIGRIRRFLAQDKYKDMNLLNVGHTIQVATDYVVTYFDVPKKKVRSITKKIYSKLKTVSASGHMGGNKLIFDD